MLNLIEPAYNPLARCCSINNGQQF